LIVEFLPSESKRVRTVDLLETYSIPQFVTGGKLRSI
jgi:hypothetical protein